MLLSVNITSHMPFAQENARKEVWQIYSKFILWRSKFEVTAAVTDDITLRVFLFPTIIFVSAIRAYVVPPLFLPRDV